jgi:protein phosphatase PTC1
MYNNKYFFFQPSFFQKLVVFQFYEYDFFWKLLLLACDGIWDVLENHEAISYLNDIILKEKIEETSEKMAESLIRLALNANSTDNLSAIVVKLNSSKK